MENKDLNTTIYKRSDLKDITKSFKDISIVDILETGNLYNKDLYLFLDDDFKTKILKSRFSGIENNINYKKILYFDLDGVLANIEDQHKKYKLLFPDQPYVQSQYGFFLDMKPIEGAIDAFKLLQEKYDVWFLTAPSWKNPMCLAEKNMWIRNNLGLELCEKIIISSDKSLCIGDYLIDDNNKGRGQDKFRGELIHFGSEKYPTWKEVLNYLL